MNISNIPFILKQCGPACQCQVCQLIDLHNQMLEYARSPHATLVGLYQEFSRIREAMDELFANRPNTQNDEMMRAMFDTLVSRLVEHMTEETTKH